MKKVGMIIQDLNTPCLLVDYDIMLDNIKKIHQFIHGNGKNVRPHTKAHKCSQLARLQIENGASGLCTANLSEAVKLFQKGFDDILITRPIVEKSKILEVLEFVRQGKNIIVVVDNEDVINTYDSMNSQGNNRLKILLDINVGFGRTGFSPDHVIDIALRAKSKKNIIIQGVQAYAGHVQHIKNYSDRNIQSIECMQSAARIFQELRDRGFECKIFSGGGTGTYNIDVFIKELTELQIGSYLLMDAQYMDVEFNREVSPINLKPSLSVLSTVISTNQDDYVTIDAGLKSIYRDTPNPIVLSEGSNDCVYDWFGDEYGKISFNNNEHDYQLGSKIKILPSHCDPTINLYDTIYLISENKVVDVLPIDLRGCSQ